MTIHSFLRGLAFCAGGAVLQAAAAPTVHMVADLGHEFSFYADGRFHRQYLPQEKGVTSWGALYHFDFGNANLLVLLGCDPHLSYTGRDKETMDAFLDVGGGVVLLGSADNNGQNGLAKQFGFEFGERAKPPITGQAAPVTGDLAGGGDTLRLGETALWQVLAADAEGRPVLARRKVGKGTLLAGARGLAGSNPDASDGINAACWQPLLRETAAGKTIDPHKPFRGRGIGELENVEQLGEITLRYSDYLQPYAAKMAAIYLRCKPVIEKRMGVPLSAGMASEIGLLATGGGGFSSGRSLGLAVFWGGFPEREDSMIEFITHEATHSWVLPFPEIWNEPIATYVGNLVMMDMGHAEESERRIKHTIERASRIDPTMKLYDTAGNSPSGAPALEGGAANDMHWGKSYWIFEQLRKRDPDFLARYFQAKRRLAKPGEVAGYDAHTTVAVLSAALGRDLFPWFNACGFAVDPAKSAVRESSRE
jgi:hypothetical protein